MGFKKDRGTNVLQEIIETAKEIFPEDEKTEIVPEEPEVIAVNNHKEAMQVIAEKIFPKAEEKKAEVKKEAPKKPAKKQREDTKVKINCGIKGDTIEVRDFRAIIKKKGLQINVVLNGIIAEWNHTNYNL